MGVISIDFSYKLIPRFGCSAISVNSDGSPLFVDSDYSRYLCRQRFLYENSNNDTLPETPNDTRLGVSVSKQSYCALRFYNLHYFANLEIHSIMILSL